MLTAVLTITAIALIAGVGLSFASRRLPSSDSDLVEQVNDLLPQTQCAQCGYPGCRPYAAAVVEGQAAINLCPPGGEDTVRRLADLLGRELIPLAEAATPAVRYRRGTVYRLHTLSQGLSCRCDRRSTSTDAHHHRK